MTSTARRPSLHHQSEHPSPIGGWPREAESSQRARNSSKCAPPIARGRRADSARRALCPVAHSPSPNQAAQILRQSGASVRAASAPCLHGCTDRRRNNTLAGAWRVRGRPIIDDSRAQRTASCTLPRLRAVSAGQPQGANEPTAVHPFVAALGMRVRTLRACPMRQKSRKQCTSAIVPHGCGNRVLASPKGYMCQNSACPTAPPPLPVCMSPSRHHSYDSNRRCCHHHEADHSVRRQTAACV